MGSGDHNWRNAVMQLDRSCPPVPEGRPIIAQRFIAGRKATEERVPEGRKISLRIQSPLTQGSAGWTTGAGSGFPLPFGRGKGQGEGSGENSLIGQAFPLTPTLSPSAGERGNRSQLLWFGLLFWCFLSRLCVLSSLRDLAASVRKPSDKSLGYLLSPVGLETSRPKRQDTAIPFASLRCFALHTPAL